MLWDVIRDFFVQYVFGGTFKVGKVLYYRDAFGGTIFGADGQLLSGSPNLTTESMTFGYLIPVGGQGVFFDNYDGKYFRLVANTEGAFMSLGDWLSNTATIITLCLLFFAAVKFVIWLTKYFAGVISMRRG